MMIFKVRHLRWRTCSAHSLTYLGHTLLPSCQTYSYITLTQGLTVLNDMKLGHYMKVRSWRPNRLLGRA